MPYPSTAGRGDREVPVSHRCHGDDRPIDAGSHGAGEVIVGQFAVEGEGAQDGGQDGEDEEENEKLAAALLESQPRDAEGLVGVQQVEDAQEGHEVDGTEQRVGRQVLIHLLQTHRGKREREEKTQLTLHHVKVSHNVTAY